MASVQFKKNKDGKKTYYVVLSLKGKHKWIKAGSLKSAKSLKKQLESLEESDRLEKLGLSYNDVRIDDFFKDYSNHVRLHTAPNTVKRYLGVLNTFLVFLKMFHSKVRYLSQVNTQIIESYQQKRLESLELKIASDGEKNGNHVNKALPKPQTVNYEITVLRSAFLYAYDRELISKVPTKKVKKLKIVNKRESIILKPAECNKLLSTARSLGKENAKYKVFSLAFKFILNSGLRSGELCNLTWDDVDLESGLIKIRAKAGWTPKCNAREFYLNETCLKLLGKIKDKQGYIFKTDKGSQLSTDILRNALLKIAGLADLEHFTRVHDLRHTFSSLLQINGVDRATTADILGHEDEKTTKIYSHTYKEHLKKSINKIEIK